nr:armadillo repeat-containing protein 7 [Aotus nancymaae]
MHSLSHLYHIVKHDRNVARPPPSLRWRTHLGAEMKGISGSPGFLQKGQRTDGGRRELTPALQRAVLVKEAGPRPRQPWGPWRCFCLDVLPHGFWQTLLLLAEFQPRDVGVSRSGPRRGGGGPRGMGGRVGKEEGWGCSIQTFPCSPTGGLCNLCPDRANKEHILQAGGIPLIINCLSSPNEETVLSAITTLIHLSASGPCRPPELTATPVVQCMLRFSLSASARLRNLAQIFLEDFCSPSQVAEARSRQAHSALGIPLPRSVSPQQR